MSLLTAESVDVWRPAFGRCPYSGPSSFVIMFQGLSHIMILYC